MMHVCVYCIGYLILIFLTADYDAADDAYMSHVYVLIFWIWIDGYKINANALLACHAMPLYSFYNINANTILPSPPTPYFLLTDAKTNTKSSTSPCQHR